MVFESPGNYASVWIFSHYAEFGWRDDYTLDEAALLDLNFNDDEPGFQIVSIWSVSPTVKRSQYQYDGKDGHCDIEGFGLHILLPNRDFYVSVEVCKRATSKYDDAFVERVFSGFSYKNR